MKFHVDEKNLVNLPQFSSSSNAIIFDEVSFGLILLKIASYRFMDIALNDDDIHPFHIFCISVN